MPNLHIIIGDTNTRKSSLLRCLTGIGVCRRTANRDFDVSLVGGGVITVHCRVSALQESGINPGQFIRDVRALPTPPTDIAFTLRVSASRGCPDAMTYIAAFLARGWPVINIALLDRAACALVGFPATARVVRVPNSAIDPTNQSARRVRTAWGWH
jgi:hypothetical protein